MAREKLIRGEEFEDQEKFKRCVQIWSHQISKMNFESKKRVIEIKLRNQKVFP